MRLRQLRGGERSGLALARLFFFPSNVLVMDEPTNHLDIDSREALEKSLSNYSGTVVVVSHDLYFLKRVVDRFYLIENERLVSLEGLEALERRALDSETTARRERHRRREKCRPSSASRGLSKNEIRRRQFQISQLESQIESLEKRKEEISLGLQAPEQHFTQLRAMAEKHEQIQLQLTELYQDWERIADELS